MKKKIIAALAMVLIVAMAVVGTYAYLTDKTTTVTNTFTVGDVQIELDEAKVDAYGVADTTATKRVTENTYKLIPGHEYTKDPIVHVLKDSEACYVFIKVVDPLANLEDTTTIAAQITSATNGWTEYTAGSTTAYKVYYKQVSAEDAAAGKDLPVFATFKLKQDADVSSFATGGTNAGKAIEVTAFAIQSDGISGEAAAFTAIKNAYSDAFPTP